MGQPDREAEPFFSQPIRQLLMMLVVLGLVLAGAYVAWPRVAPVFLANPWLNGAIAVVFVIGVLACFWQVYQQAASVNWIVGFAANRPGHEQAKPPRLLASMAALLRTRGPNSHISASSARSILDSVATRIDEVRDITRYIVNLLIFLGLLGTFFGLATTVPAVVDTIRSLAPQGNESGLEIFNRLMGGLEKQLGGMGIAFSSSLLGLAGSLVVGLLELIAGHAQNRFYRELEEWLSSITRLGFTTDGEGAGGEMGVVSAVLDHMAEQIEAMRDMFTHADESRAALEERISGLASAIDGLAGRLAADPAATGAALQRVAEAQEKLVEVLETTAAGAHVDAESRMRLRSIDVQLLRILEEMSAGRQETAAELRSDIAALTRAVRELAQAQAQAQVQLRAGAAGGEVAAERASAGAGRG
ncbi:MAG: biopolymer transporter ExbB [Alphaproteobacteria bacterium]|nr:MAG: biopolymer transporter ExbB [Alphaproteobacteria bacterium]